MQKFEEKHGFPEGSAKKVEIFRYFQGGYSKIRLEIQGETTQKKKK